MASSDAQAIKENNKLAEIEHLVDDEHLAEGISLFARYLRECYDEFRNVKVDPRKKIKCTDVWLLRYFVTMSEDSLPSRSEIIARRLLRLHTAKFRRRDNRATGRSFVADRTEYDFTEEELKCLKDYLREFMYETGQDSAAFLGAINKQLVQTEA